MRYTLIQQGKSRSFPTDDPFLHGNRDEGEVAIYLGAPHVLDESKAAIRNGNDPPSPLVELVRQPNTPESAVAAARAVFEGAGLTVAVCADHAGRIIDRLVRPKYNDALRLLDEGLASAADMDLTCRLGLGYRDGPIERVARGGLTYHHDVCAALFETTGTAAYAPARRAIVAKAREETAR